jgi:Short C-terminal domain
MGLLKTAATVAVASSVHGRIQRRQQARWAAQGQATADVPAPPPQYPAPPQPPQAHAEPVPPPQAPAAPAQPADMNDRLAQLKQLGELLSAGVLTQAEFEQQKARILNG